MNKNLFRITLSSAFTALVAASALAADRQVLHGHVPPAVAEFNLQPLGELSGTNHLHIAINLPLRNNGALVDLFKQIYSPASTNFHRYLTPEQFTEKFGPAKEDYQAVIEFAQTNGLTVRRPHPGRAVAGIDGSVADIERALHVKMLLYHHPTEARTFYAPDVEPSVDLHVPILAISGLDNYNERRPLLTPRKTIPLRSQYTDPGPGSATNGGYMGSDFRNAYASNTTMTGSGQVVGLYESVQNGGYYPGDIQLYERLAGLPNVPLVPVYQNDQSGVPGQWNDEFSVDVEMVISMAPGISNIVLYEPTDETDEEVYQEMAYPTYGETRPNQLSTSWSIDTGPASTNYLLQIAMEGQSFFRASGDGGAWPVITNYWPGFNYITEVGGTSLNMSGLGAAWAGEEVWGDSGPTGSGYGSAGGYFSSVPIPIYQWGVNMSLNHGSTQYRNAPDVAMPADNIFLVNSYQPTNGPRQTEQPGLIGGTSCASPLWAGYAALANEQAAAHGEPPLGFVNPAIYSIGQSPAYTNLFHDITVGNNTWSNSPTRYVATNGYDLCTGWGSPRNANLIDALVGLTGPVFVDFNYTGSVMNGSYAYPFNTLAKGISAVSSGATIFIMTGGSSSETMTITKPMTINAIAGAATVGK